METAETSSQGKSEASATQSLGIDRNALAGNGRPVSVEPDLTFIVALGKGSGNSLVKCFQCGTCSATCALSPDEEPFPRKEMAWANWGMKDRLLSDPDVWLCYQCNDCTTRCPRGARPGDVLAAVRQECVNHFAMPRFLARWVNQPQCIPLMLGIPVLLLTLVLYWKGPLEEALGIATPMSEEIIYAYSAMFPHWLLNSFFFFFGLLALLVVIVGIGRCWRALKAKTPPDRLARPAKGLLPSIVAALKTIITHDRFTECTRSRPRLWSHICVFFGFIALTVVTVWVITARYNPIIHGDFVYPFGFFSPWKILANLGGAALLVGCLLMMWERVREEDDTGTGSYADWALLGTLLAVVITGFATEVLHYVRLEPHRHIVYFVHLVFVFALLMYMPYSKLAHLVYRTVALVFAEHVGRIKDGQPVVRIQPAVVETKEKEHAETAS